MVKQNIRTRKNNQRKRRTKIQKGGLVTKQQRIACESQSFIKSPQGTDFLTRRGVQYINEFFPTSSECSEVSSEINKKITEEIIKESLKDLKSLLINNDLFEEGRKEFTFNCFKNFRAYGCPYESIIMEKDTTFENFLNFSSFANSFEDVEFLDLRNVKEIKYIPMNLSKMISLKYLLLPNEFAPPPAEDFKDAAEAGVNYGKKIENEVYIFDIIRMMPSLRYVEAPKPPKSNKQEANPAAPVANTAVKEENLNWLKKYSQTTSNEQIESVVFQTELNELKEGSIFKIPTDILEMYGSTQTEGTDLKIRGILKKIKDNKNVLMLPELNYGNGETYQPNLIVNFSGKSFF